MQFAIGGVVLMELTREDGLDLLEWLGLGRPEFGAIETRELLPRCRRRLWPEPRNTDPEKHRLMGTRGDTRWDVRPAGTLRLHTELLVATLMSFPYELFRFA